MTRKEIERAADVYAAKTSPTYTNGDYDCIAIAEAFEHGARWRINSVWHDASERPKFPEKVELVKFFLLCKNGECGYSQISNDDWDDVNEMAKFIKWAYVDDLLPERKGKRNE